MSECGNFFGSTLVILDESDPPAQSLSLVAGLALIEAVETAAPGHELLLKWPNDLLLEGSKLAGILLERHERRVIAGFGVNLANAPDVADRRVADLGGAIAPAAFAPLLAASFARVLGAWRSAEPSAFVRAWLERAHPVGTPLVVHDERGERIAGTFGGLNGDGGLILRLASGDVRSVHAGDVTLG